jgi:Domain of unknown function (DUF4296)
MQSTFLKSISLLFIVTACSKSERVSVDIPTYVIPKDKFVTILTHCYLGEGASSINVKGVTGEKFDSTYLFNPLKDNQVTKTEFDTSLAFYTKNPLLLKGMYEQVLENLSQMQASGSVEIKPVEKNK